MLYNIICSRTFYDLLCVKIKRSELSFSLFSLLFLFSVPIYFFIFLFLGLRVRVNHVIHEKSIEDTKGMTSYCYDLKLKGLSNKTTLVLSNTRELDRVPSAE